MSSVLGLVELPKKAMRTSNRAGGSGTGSQISRAADWAAVRFWPEEEGARRAEPYFVPFLCIYLSYLEYRDTRIWMYI